ncbi:MAG: ATP-binding protein [Pseudomonadota bacterium]
MREIGYIRQSWRALETLRQKDTEKISGRTEIQSEFAFWRISALLVTVLILSISFSDYVGVVWVGAFALCDYLDRRFNAELARTRDAPSYYKLQANFLLTLLVFRAMVVYLWYYDHPSAPYLALVVLLVATRSSSTALHKFSSRLAISAFADLSIIIFMAIQFTFFAPDILDAVYIGAALFGLAVYYVISTVQSVEKIREIEGIEQKTQQARKMEAIGRLTGGVAHDFNNLLTVIIGNIDLARETKINDEAHDLLDKTRTAADRAAELTAQLLAFARQSPLVLREHDLSQLLVRSIGLTKRLLPPNITTQLDLAPALWTVRTDAIQLETAILNLLTNARDAMPSGGQISIHARNHLLNPLDNDLPHGAYVELVIKDEGGGIPSGLLEQVTEPFFTTKPVGKGSGLGLSMVKGFVEQTGGKLDIQSVPGRSTAVTLLLPATGQISPSPYRDTGL